MVPIGLMPEGVRFDAHFEGRVVEGELTGATVAGIDPWRQLNRTVGTFNGIANPGAGTLVIEAHALVPETIAATVTS